MRRFQDMGFRCSRRRGTAKFLRARGIAAETVFKVHEGRPNGVDLIVNGQVQLLDQHAARQALADRRLHDATGRRRASHSVHDHDVRGERRVRRDTLAPLPASQVRSLQEWHEVARAAAVQCAARTPGTHRNLMPVPLLDLRAQHARIREKIIPAMMQVVEDQTFILGKPVEDFEREVAALSHTKYAIGCANGSDALLLSLRALDIGAGHEVITTPFTFFATAGMTHNSGAKPVFADIDADTFSMNPDAAAAARHEPDAGP